MTLAPCSGLVLAGGASARMGRDKAQLAWQGRTLLAHATHRLAAVCDEVRVSVAQDESSPAIGTPVIRDLGERIGPMGGLAAALATCPQRAWLVLAVDLPLVTVDLLQQILAARSMASLVTAAQTSRGPEPLCAVYEPGCAASIALAVSAREFSMMAMLHRLPLTTVPAHPELLLNVNRPQDFHQLQEGPHSNESRSSSDPK